MWHLSGETMESRGKTKSYLQDFIINEVFSLNQPCENGVIASGNGDIL